MYEITLTDTRSAHETLYACSDAHLRTVLERFTTVDADTLPTIGLRYQSEADPHGYAYSFTVRETTRAALDDDSAYLVEITGPAFCADHECSDSI